VIDEIVRVVRARHIERLYAPRWISEQVCQRAGSEIETLVSDFFLRRVDDGQPKLTMRAEAVEVMTRKTALLVDQRNADQTRACLARVGLGAGEIVIGPWILFDCRKEITAKGHVLPPLRWVEKGCFLSLQLAAKNNADYWYRKVQNEGGVGADTDRAIDGLRRAVDFYPAYQPALAQLADILSRTGQTNEALVCRQELLRRTQPAREINASFRSGVELLGVDLPAHAVRRGSSFPLTYYWRCPAELKTEKWAVFVHFVRGKETSFQDDHVLMADVSPVSLHDQPFPEVFRVSRQVQIPAGVVPGEYRIRLGIYNRLTLKRDRPSTSQCLDDKAVWLPATLRVEE
jgi:hypothetical protein